MNKKFFYGIALLLALGLSGCVIQPLTGNGDSGPAAIGAESGAPKSVEGRGPDRLVDAYLLRPQDPLFIRFSGIPDQQPLEISIDEKGEINLLHLKPLIAAGLTTSELASEIERKYREAQIYNNISVVVTMTAKAYYVQGCVHQPGQFPLTSGTTLMQAVSSARGFDPYANKKKVTITRHGQIYTYNYIAIEKDPSKDVKIEPGDVIKIWQKKF